MSIRQLLRLSAACACLLVIGSAFAAPRDVRLSYAAYMNGMAIGLINEHFEIDGSQYRIVSDTKPTGLAALALRQPLRFTSTGQVSREGLRPHRFEARRGAADSPQVIADFDWQAGRVHLRHSGKSESHPLLPGTQDRLSMMYQFMFLAPFANRLIEFSMTNGRKLDRYRYRVSVDVEIDTPVGRLKTVHLAKVRDPGDTTAEIWLSREHGFLPVKTLIIERDGMRFEQVVQALDVRE